MAPPSRRVACVAAVLAAAAVTPAHGQFQFEIPTDAFFDGMGGGGGFQQQRQRGGRRQRSAQVQVPNDIHEAYAWMKGTEWKWNAWRNVKFDRDGNFDAPTPECEHRRCKWSADATQVYIQWGQAGLHTVVPDTMAPVEGNNLVGKRVQDGDRCSAAYVGKEVNDEDLDFYEVLGVAEEDEENPKAIKKAFRRLSLLYHPDKCAGTFEVEDSAEPLSCERMMARVNLANEVLSDADKKILYDTGGMESVKKGMAEDEGQGGGGMDPFSAFFGGGGQRRSTTRGNDATVSFEVTLEDFYNGGDLSATINRRTVCRGCATEKKKNSERCQSCGRCPDEVKMVQRQMGPGMIVQQEERVRSKEKCKNENTVLATHVEKGMAAEMQIKFERMAEQTPGLIPGSVLMTLKQKRHKTYTRDGNNLHMKLELTLKEALLGFKKTFTHMDGHEFAVSRAKPTRHGAVLTKQGEGMPHHEVSSEFGDLLVTVSVRFPSELTDEQKEAIDRLF